MSATSDAPIVLWRGVAFSWALTSHRLPLLETFVDNAPAAVSDSAPASISSSPPAPDSSSPSALAPTAAAASPLSAPSGPRSASPSANPPPAVLAHRFGLRVGAFPPDRARARVDALIVHDPAVHLVARGRATLPLEGRVGWWAHARTAVRLDASPPAVDRARVVVLDGFSLRALENPAGWHLGGLGASVALAPGGLEVAVRHRPAESPHPGIFGVRPWSFDRACRSEASVGWAVLDVPADRAAPFAIEARAASTVTLAFEAPIRPDAATRSSPVLPPAIAAPPPAHDARAAPTSEPPAHAGHAILAAFDLSLDAPALLRRRSGYLRNLNGRYVRSLCLAARLAPTDVLALAARPAPTDVLALAGRPAPTDLPDLAADPSPARRAASGDRIVLGLSCAPHPVLRAGAVAGLALTTALAAFVLVSGPHRELGALALAAVTLLTWCWPSVWLEAPSVPFEARWTVSGVALDVRATPAHVCARHRPGPDGRALHHPES